MANEIVKVLEKNGATDIEGYTLISNFGYTFNLNGMKCDARYWANCYGCALDKWDVTSLEQDADGKYIRLDEDITDKLEHELNEIGRGW